MVILQIPVMIRPDDTANSCLNQARSDRDPLRAGSVPGTTALWTPSRQRDKRGAVCCQSSVRTRFRPIRTQFGERFAARRTCQWEPLMSVFTSPVGGFLRGLRPFAVPTMAAAIVLGLSLPSSAQDPVPVPEPGGAAAAVEALDPANAAAGEAVGVPVSIQKRSSSS